MTGEIVPFGKYKGQPAEVLASDAGYAEWLLAQPWFRERYGNVYNVLINYGGEPQDSPEHNQMQAAFLEEHWCIALADCLGLRQKHGLTAARQQLAKDPFLQQYRQDADLAEHDMEICDLQFEVRGWDVAYDIVTASITRRLTSLPGCSCICDHSSCRETATCKGGPCAWRCGHERCAKRQIDDQPGKVRTDYQYHCSDECPWKSEDTGRWLLCKREAAYHASASAKDSRVCVELKPDLGDDYPAVLRQVAGYPFDGWVARRCVIARRHDFQHVTWDQVRQIFASSKITLLAESELR
jgi:hypothetical protein